MKHPEIDNIWEEREIEFGENKYILKDKRHVEKNTEERIQIFENKKHRQEIITNRFYYSKAEIQKKLLEAGFSEIKYINNYDYSTQHSLQENEKTDSDYICFAINNPAASRGVLNQQTE